MLQYDMVVCTYIGQITAISADNLLYRQISVVSADIVAYRQIICKCRYICISVWQIICIGRYAKKLYRSYSKFADRFALSPQQTFRENRRCRRSWPAPFSKLHAKRCSCGFLVRLLRRLFPETRHVLPLRPPSSTCTTIRHHISSPQ